jgi:hypothetical protein
MDGFTRGKREHKFKIENNKKRKTVLRGIAKYVKSKLSPEEEKFFVEVNAMLRDRPLTDEGGEKLEENGLEQTAEITRDPSVAIDPNQTSLNNDPKRTVGTGTYTSTWSTTDMRSFNGMKGWDPTDSASAGSHPVYVD